MKKKDYKELIKELDLYIVKIKEKSDLIENKLNFANGTVYDLTAEIYAVDALLERTDKHMLIAENELKSKERLIVELKIWIQDLARGGE